jgi:pimeloyl-ACP methyl ester carboxylesterase
MVRTSGQEAYTAKRFVSVFEVRVNKEVLNRYRRQLLRMTGSIAVASLVESLNCRAQEVRPKKALEIKQGASTISVDDIRIYCEVRGTGPLMILLNGMWLDTLTNYFAVPFMDALAKHYTVLTFDPRGQGRTTLGNGPITYGRFAADVVRLMDKLGLDSAHFIGHSDGGCIQLNLLIDFCDRVKTATLLGTPYSHNAYNTKTKTLFSDWFAQMTHGLDVAESSEIHELGGRYRKVSPHPEKFHEMLLLQRKCYATEPNIGLRQLAGINRPVLVIAGGMDQFISKEHFKLLADTIPEAQRVDFPDMTHDIGPHLAAIAKAASDFTDKHK